jgi:hypothetical protein
VFRLTLPRTAGAEIIGSPLPLRPDLADLDGMIPHRRGELNGDLSLEPAEEHR